MTTSSKHPLTIDEIVTLLGTLGVQVQVNPDDADSPAHLVTALSLGLVGAAELHAIHAEETARAAGVDQADIAALVGEGLNAAGCTTEHAAWRLLTWRATRMTQALQVVDTTGPNGNTDPLARTIMLTAAALAGLLSAATTMRDVHRENGETRYAARAVRSAVQALEEATDAARANRYVADLLEMTN